MTERNKWWGYLHTEGTINAKRWWGEQSNADIDDAHSSPFVVRVIGPFEADTREDALRHIKMEL